MRSALSSSRVSSGRATPTYRLTISSPVTINSPASPQWLQAPMPSSRTLGLLLPYLTPKCCRALGTHAATTSPQCLRIWPSFHGTRKILRARFLRYFNRLRLSRGNGRNRVERHAVMAVKFSWRTHHEPQAKQVSSFPAVGTGRSEGLGDHWIDRRQQLSPGLGPASHRIGRRQAHPQTTRGT